MYYYQMMKYSDMLVMCIDKSLDYSSQVQYYMNCKVYSSIKLNCCSIRNLRYNWHSGCCSKGISQSKINMMISMYSLDSYSTKMMILIYCKSYRYCYYQSVTFSRNSIGLKFMQNSSYTVQVDSCRGFSRNYISYSNNYSMKSSKKRSFSFIGMSKQEHC